MCDEDLYSLFKADPCKTTTCLVLHSIVENTHVSIPLDPLLEVIDYCALDRPLLDRVPNLTFEDALLHALPAVEERLQSAFRDFIATFSSHVVGNSTEEEPTRSMHLAIGALAANECLADMCEYLKPPKELGPYLKLLYRAYYSVVNVQNMYYGPATFHWKSLTTYDTDDYVHKSEFMWTRGPLVCKIERHTRPGDDIPHLFGVVIQIENGLYIVSIPPMKFTYKPYERFVKSARARLHQLRQVEDEASKTWKQSLMQMLSIRTAPHPPPPNDKKRLLTPPITWKHVPLNDLTTKIIVNPIPVVCVSKMFRMESKYAYDSDFD
eukprot:PhF_6_TR23751/c0_g1_i1/m.33190